MNLLKLLENNPDSGWQMNLKKAYEEYYTPNDHTLIVYGNAVWGIYNGWDADIWTLGIP